VTTQFLDLTLIVVGENGAMLIEATLDGDDFLDEIGSCEVPGDLEALIGGTVRCPLGRDFLGEGRHTFEATFELDDGQTIQDAVEWEVLETTED
jgi:hypothetical protein